MLTLSDLFAQNNENRPFFPRLIWLGLAALSHYDVRLELWTDWAIAIGTSGFLAVQTVRIWRELDSRIPALLLPLMALLVFNLGQWESWLQGFQMVMFLGSACFVCGYFFLGWNATWPRFALAIIAGVVGSFSTPNNLLYWPIGLGVLVLAAPARDRLLRSALWTACGAACVALFLGGWKPTPGLAATMIVRDIPARAYWVTNFLGAPLMSIPDLAFPFGVLSIALWLVALTHLARTGRLLRLAPYVAIAAFVLASGVLISFGRLGLGIVQAVAPRYLTISAWYWVSLLALLPLLPFRRILQRVLYSLTTVCLLWMMVWGIACAVAFHSRLLPAYKTAVSGGYMTDAVLSGIAQPGSYDAARSSLQYLAENKLSAYAHTK